MKEKMIYSKWKLKTVKCEGCESCQQIKIQFINEHKNAIQITDTFWNEGTYEEIIERKVK